MPQLNEGVEHFLRTLLSNAGILAFAENLHAHLPESHVYLVGGTVRDAILQRDNKADFDLVVSNVSAQTLENFLSTIGKVGLVGKNFGVFKFVLPGQWSPEPIDIALPRTDHAFMTGGYRDLEVQSDPALPIEEDLARRDFTINAMAVDLKEWTLVDAFHGQTDLQAKRLRTVGEARQRFSEEYTRMLRAIRFACQLDFTIEPQTWKTIQEMAEKIQTLPAERVRDEFTKIILSDNGAKGVDLLMESGILRLLIPELEQGVGVTQNKNHIYTVFIHNLKSLETACERNYSMAVRLGALFHDVGKPMTKQGDGPSCTFYNHDLVGGKLTRHILQRLKYPNDLINEVTHLVKNHMFYYSIGQVSDAGVRRLLVRLGKNHIGSFIQLRICDRLGMGRPKAKPYKLLELERRLHEVQMDPISTKMLAIDGNEIMRILGIFPGPRVGRLLKALLNEVLENPALNTAEYLIRRAGELQKISDEELSALSPDIESYEQKKREQFFQQYSEIE